jgi:hypothetical protein
MCSTTSSDEIENIHLLNVLNWSPLEDLVITTQPSTDEPKLKNFYNAVQLSIELQKKMLK